MKIRFVKVLLAFLMKYDRESVLATVPVTAIIPMQIYNTGNAITLPATGYSNLTAEK